MRYSLVNQNADIFRVNDKCEYSTSLSNEFKLHIVAKHYNVVKLKIILDISFYIWFLVYKSRERD